MPNWGGLILTKKGRNLQAKVETGIILYLTKMKLGSGVLPGGKTLEDLADLVEPRQVLGIAEKIAQDDGLCKISSTISNSGLEQGYYVRELGVFANDPDEGEILYAVTTDSAPDYLPADGGAMAISQEFAVYIAISNAESVYAVIDNKAMATIGYVADMIAEHNSDPDAHPNLIKSIDYPTIDAILGTDGIDPPDVPGILGDVDEITLRDIDELFAA